MWTKTLLFIMLLLPFCSSEIFAKKNDVQPALVTEGSFGVGLGRFSLVDIDGKCGVKIIKQGVHYVQDFNLDISAPCYLIDFVSRTHSYRMSAISLGKGSVMVAVVGQVDQNSLCGKDIQGMMITEFYVRKNPHSEKVSSFLASQDPSMFCIREGVNLTDSIYPLLWGK